MKHKILWMLGSFLLVAALVLTGCPAPVVEEPVVEEEEEEPVEEIRVEDFRFALVGVMHPYFAPFEIAAADFMADTGIHTTYRAASTFCQDASNIVIEGMLALGYNAFAMWPGHPSAVNVTVTELVEQGIPVTIASAPVDFPTDASLAVATDVKASAMAAAEHLIEAMGGKGNIVNLLGALGDPNTILRRDGVEEVVARYPDVTIITELADIDVFEPALDKIGSELAARVDEIDGMITTNYICTVVGSELLTELGDKRIKFVGIDDDPKVLQAIRDGYIVGAMSQSPYGQAYLTLEALRLLKMGYTVKEGVWMIDSGSFLINRDNVEIYADIIKANVTDMLETFAEDYFNPPE
ncbi:MAG: substrate-binding domain-containing protein [Clostridia bacterium]|nr:substrate-binding domain-containing protein [Clostridia bacterium]